MKKILFIIVTFLSLHPSHAAENYKKAYFGGGCFWCVEEYFDNVEGVIKTISGYSGGLLPNPTYKQVTYEDTGHVETVEVTYDPNLTNYQELLNIHILNIDPFDNSGQFCDKGKSYRSVIFYKDNNEKDHAEKKLKQIEIKFKKKPSTLIWKFEKFYFAEDHHQNYYEKNFINYLLYKSGCGRDYKLSTIWQ